MPEEKARRNLVIAKVFLEHRQINRQRLLEYYARCRCQYLGTCLKAALAIFNVHNIILSSMW